MAKLVKSIIVFGPAKGHIKVIKKYANPGQTIDESLMSTLCLPRIELVDEPQAPRFQTFLVTKEDGQVLYGSGLLVHDRHHDPPPYPGAGRFASYCYTIITDTPFINATRSLLYLIWEKKCDDIIVRSVMNIPLPAKRKCLRIVPPPSSIAHSNNKSTSTKQQQASQSKFILVNGSPVKVDDSQSDTDDSRDGRNKIQHKTKDHTNKPQKPSGLASKLTHLCQSNATIYRTIDDIYLYRGMPDLPLLDYPLRELFSFLQVDDLLLAFACILMEFRTLIISEDNYKLMMVGETLTSLLLPLKWCNVYVPILPPVYGATYLDAPTSYIMGINPQVTELPDSLQHVQCRIYCDESRVVCDADSLALPLFLNDLKRDIMQIEQEFNLTTSKHDTYQHVESENNNLQTIASTRHFTYLEDLKFNRAIRILFMKTIRKNILANYERYIVDVPESSRDIRQFDVVSYLSDKPEFMYSFLSKFLDTQLFASFIDENAKRMQQSWLSIFDMDPDELSEHFTDKALESAFQCAQRVHLMDLRDEHADIDVKTVPASPMKLRRRVPALASSIASRLTFASSKSSSNSASIDPGSVTAPVLDAHNAHALITKTPPVHRNSVATISLKGHLSLEPHALHPSPPTPTRPMGLAGSRQALASDAPDSATAAGAPPSLASMRSASVPLDSHAPNGKIVELINEVRDLTKSILIENMGVGNNSVLDVHLVPGKVPHNRRGNYNTLIGSLCDHIERVWAHGSFITPHDNSAGCCPLWSHLISFTRLKYLDSRPRKRHEFSDGSHLNVLSSVSTKSNETSELDRMVVKNMSLSSSSASSTSSSSSLAGLAAASEKLHTSFSTPNNLLNSTFNLFKSNAHATRHHQAVGSLERDLIQDMITVLELRDVKTDVGKARAFIRLSLERKKLSKHLKTLLGDQALLNSLYKPYAFLRCEDEREQFLMYLLTLNTVDLPCFTSTFVNVINTRRMKTNNAGGASATPVS